MGKLVRNCGLLSLVHIRKLRGWLMFLNSLTVRQNETPMTDHRGVHHKKPLFPPYFMGTYDRPSYPQWSVLHNRHGCQRPWFWGSQNSFLVSLDGTLRWTIMPTTVLSKQQSRFSKTFFLRVSIFLSSVHRRISTTNLHAYDGPSCTTVTVVRDFLPDNLKKNF